MNIDSIQQSHGVSRISKAAKNASVYSGQAKATDFSLIFNGADIQVIADGAAWLSSKMERS